MDFKENVINFFSILALLAGQLLGLRGPDLARGPLIKDLWPIIRYGIIQWPTTQTHLCERVNLGFHRKQRLS